MYIVLKQKLDKTEEGLNAQLFIKLSVLSGLFSNYALNMIAIVLEVLLFKSHFKLRIQAL